MGDRIHGDRAIRVLAGADRRHLLLHLTAAVLRGGGTTEEKQKSRAEAYAFDHG
jgi:hypothetical protein